MAARARKKRPAAEARLRKALEFLTAGPEAQWPQRIAAAAQKARADARPWLRSASVQGLGIGRRTVGGKPTRELVLKVYVDRKLPLEKLRSPAPVSLRVPGVAGKVPVDVQEIGRIARENGMARARPAAPGAGIGLEDAVLGTGTLGCLVRKRGDAANAYLLSNAHVIARDGIAPRGTAVLQPSAQHGGQAPADVLARLEKSVKLSFTPEGYYNFADAAIARLVRPQDALAQIPGGIGVPRGPGYSVRTGMRVRIAGAASGYAEGRVLDQNFFFATEYEVAPGEMRRAGFRDQVLCTSYSQRGDSGAAVVDDQGRVVGLHVGGSTEGGTPCSVFSPIAHVLEALQIDLVTGAAPAAALHATATPGAQWLPALLPALGAAHGYGASVAWKLTPAGLEVAGNVEATQGAPQTVARVWERYGGSIVAWAEHFRVPVELVIATICTESGGNPLAQREEPGWTSDAATPKKVSAGLMQTLVSTAREALGSATIDRGWLLVPDHSIQAGTAYIDRQRRATLLDPPKVACAYNAGGIYANDVPANRWRMRQYPKDSSAHADRFVRWFNDCFRLFRERGGAPAASFFAALN